MFEVTTETLVDTLADTLALVKVETVNYTLAKLEYQALVKKLSAGLGNWCTIRQSTYWLSC